MTRYDMIYLTAIGLTSSGSSTVHIYTQTIHRTTQSTQTVHRTTHFKFCESVRTPAIFIVSFSGMYRFRCKLLFTN